MTSTVEVEGLGPILAKLRELEQTAKYVQPVLKQIGQEIINEAGQYPIPQTEYRRTMRLKQGWRSEPMNMSVVVRNPVPYAPWVHGDDTQVSFHTARGWKKLMMTAEMLMPRLVAGLREQLRRIIG